MAVITRFNGIDFVGVGVAPLSHNPETATSIGNIITSQLEKTTSLVANDKFPISNSENSGILQWLSWTTLKTQLNITGQLERITCHTQ